MIVQCPSCSTGYHLALPAPSAVLRCSRCSHLVPPPSGRRSYVLGAARPAAAPLERPSPIRVAEPMPPPPPPQVPMVEMAPLPPAPSPEMRALDAALFSPVSHRSAPTRVPPPTEVEPAGASALLPVGLSALAAAAAWFAAPHLASWIPPLPFALEPWMLAAAGAASGLLLGGVWLRWRAGRR